MSDEAAAFAIGAVVSCEDGECGELRRMVVDSAQLALTHLVVEPGHRGTGGRLVPIGLVEGTAAREVRLRCTLAQFGALDRAEETEVRPEVTVDWESHPGDAQTMWRFGLRAAFASGLGRGPGPGLGGDVRIEPRAVLDERIPLEEGEVSRGQHVHASDGPIGHVLGLVTDPRGHRVTHVLLAEGHLWGRKEVAVPIGAVRFVVDDGVYLNLTKEEVGDLPPADLEHLEHLD